MVSDLVDQRQTASGNGRTSQVVTLVLPQLGDDDFVLAIDGPGCVGEAGMVRP